MLSNPWVRSIRPHQWSKAALVIAAPFAAFHVSVAIVTQLTVAVALACVAASGTYLLNDAIDAPADRLHPTKRHRPIASGAIGRFEAVLVAVVLLAAAPLSDDSSTDRRGSPSLRTLHSRLPTARN